MSGPCAHGSPGQRGQIRTAPLSEPLQNSLEYRAVRVSPRGLYSGFAASVYLCIQANQYHHLPGTCGGGVIDGAF